MKKMIVGVTTFTIALSLLVFPAKNASAASYSNLIRYNSKTTVKATNYKTIRYIPYGSQWKIVWDQTAKKQQQTQEQTPTTNPTNPTNPTTPATPTTPAPQEENTPSKDTTNTPSTDAGLQQLSKEEQEMVNLVNEERQKAGLQPLQVDLELTRVAKIKSQDMVDNGYFSHTSPTYGSPFDMMKSFGIRYTAAGENIAKNASVAKAHVALMNSEGHRKNILSSSFTHVGIGIHVDRNGYVTITQMFIRK